MLAHTDATMQHHSGYLMQHLREVKKLPEEVVEGLSRAYEKFQTRDFGIEDKRQINDWCARQAYIALGNMMSRGPDEDRLQPHRRL